MLWNCKYYMLLCIMFNKYHASDSSKWTRKAWLFVNRAPWSYGKGLVSGM